MAGQGYRPHPLEISISPAKLAILFPTWAVSLLRAENSFYWSVSPQGQATGQEYTMCSTIVGRTEPIGTEENELHGEVSEILIPEDPGCW